MENTKWVVEASSTVELLGRRFAGRDGGGPQLCNMVCSQLGRHAHIDFCRTNPSHICQGPDWEHSEEIVYPQPDRKKDWISHALYWARTGFKDPYSREEQTEFSKCDARCAGPEHRETGAQSSYCTLPLFHPPHPQNWSVSSGMGHVSADGHSFECADPALSRPAYHVIFVLDRSGSMAYRDRTPLFGTPVTSKIINHHNNRYGAVLSSLFQFWTSRAAGITGSSSRRDSYSIILFNLDVQVVLENDFNSDPNTLLSYLLGSTAHGGTSFDKALTATRALMESHWSSDRSPVVIFLSDGECGVSDEVVDDLARRAIALGKPLSLYTISFGTESYSTSLRSMARIADEIGQNAPRDALTRPVTSTYCNAINTIQLAETFLDIAESLRNPRASLIRS
ncbi:hypothetical protein FRC02_011492 [Tulasnella sp. 418]|nr:hypothetical protein FRC02_011492 [Tulasnella sp. 418]